MAKDEECLSNLKQDDSSQLHDKAVGEIKEITHVPNDEKDPKGVVGRPSSKLAQDRVHVEAKQG